MLMKFIHYESFFFSSFIYDQAKNKNKSFTQGQTKPEENFDLDNTERKIEKQHL